MSLVVAAVEAVEKWKALLAFQAKRLFYGPLYAVPTGLVLINFATGQHSPGDPCQLVGDGDNKLVAWGSVLRVGAPIVRSRRCRTSLDTAQPVRHG